MFRFTTVNKLNKKGNCDCTQVYDEGRNDVADASGHGARSHGHVSHHSRKELWSHCINDTECSGDTKFPQHLQWGRQLHQVCNDTRHTRTHTRTHTHARTHAHTHTHTVFYGLWGLSIGIMFLYCTNCMCYCPTPKLSPHRRLCISTFPPKNSLCMIYKSFELWGHWKYPH